MGYSIDPISADCYEGTTCLINKLLNGGVRFQCKTDVRQRIYDRPAPQIA